MARFGLTYDMWSPPFATVSLEKHYAAMLDQVEYADRHGFSQIAFNEHHGVPEGYLPSPLVATAAAAARTKRLALRPMVLAPFFDPLRLAEDLAVLDQISGGRLTPVLAAGYRFEEFEMFGRDPSQRGRMIDETVEVLRRAWTGEPFDYRGRTVRVTPRPAQRPPPPIILGGSSAAAARRAARIADGFHPTDPRFYEIYRDECARLGKEARGRPALGGPMFVHVAEDPERDWALIEPFVLNAVRRYRGWALANEQSTGPTPALFAPDSGPELRASTQYRVLTVDECVELAESLEAEALVVVRPQWGGFDPDVGWASLELIAEQVLPQVQSEP